MNLFVWQYLTNHCIYTYMSSFLLNGTNYVTIGTSHVKFSIELFLKLHLQILYTAFSVH